MTTFYIRTDNLAQAIMPTDSDGNIAWSSLRGEKADWARLMKFFDQDYRSATRGDNRSTVEVTIAFYDEANGDFVVTARYWLRQSYFTGEVHIIPAKIFNQADLARQTVGERFGFYPI